MVCLHTVTEIEMETTFKSHGIYVAIYGDFFEYSRFF